MAIYKPGSGFSLDTEYAGTFILDFAASRTVRNKFLLLTTHPIYDIQFIAPQTDFTLPFTLFSLKLLKNGVL